MRLEPALLENAFVRLEPLDDSHREEMRRLAREAELWEWTSVRGDGPGFDAWFDPLRAGQPGSRQFGHAVRICQTGELAGHTSFVAIDPDHARVEVGWTWYGAPWRGGFVNPACKLLMLGRAFDAGAQRVELKTHHLNQRSQRAMLRMGAVQEGTLRSHMVTWRGDRRDTVYFSVLPHEWPAVREGLERRLQAFAPAA